MPVKKKVTETKVEAAAPAPKRTAAATRAKRTAPPAAPAEAAPEVKTKAPARKKTPPAASAATHKAPARKLPAKPAVFDVEAHRAEIEREAYFLWLDRGGVHGSPDADWLRAVETVKARRS